jgi:hypothetical protein
MPRTFSFEREMYATLELIPLGVRRKLDLAGVKLSLAGWQALPLADRRVLADAGVEDEAQVEAFARALREAGDRAGVRLDPLPPAELRWRAPAVPAELRALLPHGVSLDDAAWAALDDEARYVLVHLAGSASRLPRLRTALVELGLAAV